MTFGTWAIFPQLREISLTIDLDASHYLHNTAPVSRASACCRTGWSPCSTASTCTACLRCGPSCVSWDVLTGRRSSRTRSTCAVSPHCELGCVRRNRKTSRTASRRWYTAAASLRRGCADAASTPGCCGNTCRTRCTWTCSCARWHAGWGSCGCWSACRTDCMDTACLRSVCAYVGSSFLWSWTVCHTPCTNGASASRQRRQQAYCQLQPSPPMNLHLYNVHSIGRFHQHIVYKYYHNLLPLLFVDFFCLNENIHTYYTRRRNALHLPAVRTILRKRSIIFTGPIIWNQLNPFFHILHSVSSFKFKF